MDRATIIIDTLEKVAERAGDPYEQIYAKLFAEHPEFLDLFVMDKDGGVRANMLTSCIDCLIGTAEGSDTPRLLLEAARIQHDGYGLGDADIDLMFEVIRDVFRDILGEDWTASIDAAWTNLLAELSQIGRAVE